MKPGQPSYTAEVLACYRAVESLKPAGVRVCHDPYARYFLRRGYRLLGAIPPLARFVFWLMTARGYSGDAAQGIARTRFIDDFLLSAIADGARQLVILGAGYDTRGYRLREVAGNMRVFELDDPHTQMLKKQRVQTIFGQLHEHILYVPIEFDTQRISDKLFEYGYDERIRTVFIWEGVTYFLTEDAVDETLRFVLEHSSRGSSIIFDYTFKSVIDGTYPSDEARKELKIMERIGEPYRFGIEAGEIETFLRSRGFRSVTQISPEHMSNLYFASRGDQRQVAPFLPLVHAEV